MEIKLGYKQTEIGVIPEDWDVKALKQFATVKGGKRLPRGRSLIEKPTAHPYIRVTDMRPGGIDVGDIKYVPDDVYPTIKNYRITCRDLFISVAGTLGIVGKIPPELEGANLTENADRITQLSCDQDFLLYNFSSNHIQSTIDSVRTVGAQPKLALGQIENFKFALPATRAEQSAIAQVLSDVDGLLRGLDCLITKKRNLKQAVMHQLLTGQTRLPDFNQKLEFINTEIGRIPEDWIVVAVKEIARSHRQGYYTMNPYSNDGVRLVRITDLMNPQLDYTSMPMLRITQSDHELYRIRRGDFLFARSGAIGRYGIVYRDIDAIFGSYIIRFTFDSTRLTNEFFGYLYQTRTVWRQLLAITQGSSNININASNIKSIRIPLPSVAEQTAIAEVLTDMDVEIAALEQRHEKIRVLKQSMMQELLTGKTRLI